MNEALKSVSIKFQVEGFECQITYRTGSPVGDLPGLLPGIIESLKAIGAIPPVHDSTNNNHCGSAELTPPNCEGCKRSDEMELVNFTLGGKPHRAWKCQRCQKWGKRLS